MAVILVTLLFAVSCYRTAVPGDAAIDASVYAAINVTGVVEITASTYHSCVRRSSGTVSCWDDNQHGELGDGTTTQRLTPVTVTGLTDAIGVAAGGYFTCAVRATGGVVCWGRNSEGEIGDGISGTARETPVAVVGLTDAVEITAGHGHFCARRTSGAIVCWGINGDGEIGDGTSGINRLTPAAVVGL